MRLYVERKKNNINIKLKLAIWEMLLSAWVTCDPKIVKNK